MNLLIDFHLSLKKSIDVIMMIVMMVVINCFAGKTFQRVLTLFPVGIISDAQTMVDPEIPLAKLLNGGEQW